MTPNERKAIVASIQSIGKQCYIDAASRLEECAQALRAEMFDGEKVERDIGDALVLVGEARGHFNAAVDVAEWVA